MVFSNLRLRSTLLTAGNNSKLKGLFLRLVKNNFQKYIKSLVDYCDENNIKLLRTIGVIFGDDEKRISEYVN